MFHTYVLANSGTVVDFDRASFLMDKDLLQQSLDAMRHAQATEPSYDADHWAQWVWDDYRERHHKRYGDFFVPDVTPNWDQGPEGTAGPPRRRKSTG